MATNHTTNQLANEKSPYLLQHAHNPVNWFPWGDEAFTRAKEENKPIFLSVGYSTCHWCHVMAHESFEDSQVADYLNEHYVAIKVDREERPDVDHVYMMYCQALTGEGGWPLTVIMTPEGHPFFAGTYFPKSARYGRPGLLDILAQLSEKWTEDADKLRIASEGITERLQPIFRASPGAFEASEAVHTAFHRLSDSFDSFAGGFGDAPKFPMFHQMMFLLRYHRYTGENEALLMVEETLKAIAKGGIYDHVGGGISRYSTDGYWRVPHFEKMLYDNALAVITYTEAYQMTKEPQFKAVALDILRFIEREMTSNEGAFYAAQDADSEGQEGRYYVWRPDDVEAALGEIDGPIYCAFYDITEEGNFEGYSVPNYIDTDVASFALSHGWSEDELRTKLIEWNRQLYEWRDNREHPSVDDKVLTAWNALMVVAMAKAGAVNEVAHYVEAAKRTLSFVEGTLVNDEMRLLARYRDGEAGILAYADDYAYLIWAYLELYQATLDQTYLDKASEWQQRMNDLFWNDNQHAFALSGRDAEKLIASPVTAYDGATPSANSVAALNLARLFAITGNGEYSGRVDAMFGAFGEMLTEAPTEHIFLLMAGFLVYGGSTEVVIASNEDDEEGVRSFAALWHSHFLPDGVLLKPEARTAEQENYRSEGDSLTFYVCRQFHCERPDLNGKDALERVVNTPPRFS